MSKVVMIDTPGMTADQYRTVIEKLGMRDSLPDGCLAHIAGPSPDASAWRVITVWDDLDKLASFRDTQLMPAQSAAGITAPAVPPAIWDLESIVVRS